MIPRVIIHVGLQKTGSTALHHFLQSNRADLSDRLAVMTPVKGSAVRTLGRRARQYSRDPALAPAFSDALELLRNEILEQGDRTCLISHENLLGAMPGTDQSTVLYPMAETLLAQLDQALSEFEPHYVLYTRDLREWKKSAHNQAVKSDGYAGTHAEFVEGMEQVVAWDCLLDRLRTSIDADRLHAFTVENESDPTRPGAQMLRLAGLSETNISGLIPLNGKRNESLNSGALEFTRLVNSMGLKPSVRAAVARLVANNQPLFASN